MTREKQDFILFLKGKKVGIIPVKKVDWIWNPLTKSAKSKKKK